MIIGDPYRIAIQVEQVDTLCSPSGIFNFIINDLLIPGKGVTIDLYIVISSLKESLDLGLKRYSADVGNAPIEKIDFSEGEPENLIPLNVAELHDYGCNFWLGFSGNEDRLFYSLDFESSFIESRFPRGTVEELIRTLPLAGSLFMDKSDDVIITKLK
ncbi:TPA: immunity 42 family protein [Serratia fonticola]|jgi:hypothetical protein|uniref:immunity 42 family protein n=1 Tax=Serratia fonticola TaxID=47917 RepID=UPI000FB6049A|nr:immunity 42 family protein [Serratia fonticola]CAI2154583.1 Uncharacterised protein [Serratia fonticola]